MATITELRIEDNSDKVGAEFAAAVLKALTECGMKAEGYAKTNLTEAKPHAAVDTGALRNSVTYKVDSAEKCVYVGTNQSYGVYVEMGTGKYVAGGSPPWCYQDRNGRWHRTSGYPARPFIKPAVADHEEEYRKIVKKELQG